VLDPVVGFLGALLPGFAAPWVTAFRQNLWVLLGFAAVFTVLLWRNAALGGLIEAHADAAWRHVSHGMPGPAPPPGARTRTTRFRTVLGGPYRAWVQSVFPWLAAILIVVLGVVAGVTRIIFDVRSSLGAVCAATPSASLREPRPTQTLLFATVEGCAATGIELHAGQRYAVEVAVLAPWKDGDLVASPDGLEAPRWWMTAAVPMRRLWTEPWFRLMGRIGDTGDDQYPLRSGRTVFRARTDGELFLYVNDVVIGIAPKRWDRAYSWRWGRNEGTATIQVTRLP